MTRSSTAAQQESTPILSNSSGAEGTEVVVRVPGLSPGDPIMIGFGGIGSPHEIMGEAVADERGTARLSIRVPGWVEPSRTYLFYWAWRDMRPVSFSAPFLVTASDGTVRITGTVTDEGVTCTAMRAEDETLYTLAGAGDVAVGERITVDATVAEMSICGQGLTLDVRAVERGPGSGGP